jgi:LacI family transcriptional regulator
MTQPRLKDVAEAAGVHVATASRALNERTASMVSPDTVERVREAARSLGYRPNHMARGLKTRRSFTIGMLIPDIMNPFFPPMVRGAEDGLAEAGYTLVFADTDNDQEKGRRAQDVFLERRVDGMLLGTVRRRDTLVDDLQRASLPFVLVNRTIDRGGVAAVIPDDQAGMTLAVEHLHELGHLRIGHVAGPSGTSTGWRRASGFRAAVQPHASEPPPVVEAASYSVAAGTVAGAELLAFQPRPSAVVAANDLLALGVLDAAAAMGLSCPADVSIVGFNDMPFVDRLTPSLTTIRIDTYDIGRRAARLLLGLIEDPEARRETILIAPQLITRGSTGPAA